MSIWDVEAINLGTISVPSLTGWDTNVTIAEQIIQYALDLAESLEAGKSSVDLATILNYYNITGLADTIRGVLASDISTGGYGLDSRDELDIWNRARDREAINAQMAVDEAKRNYSMSAFTLPSGALTQALERATGVGGDL